MTTVQQNELQKLNGIAEAADATLMQLAREAIAAGDAELQKATISTPLMGIETLRVYMNNSGDSNNVIYPMRLAFAADPTRGDCILAMLAELAVEFGDVEMIEAIRQNPSAGQKTKEVLAV